MYKDLNDFVERLKNGFGEDLIGIILFGSRARGDEQQGSDYDIFLILDTLPKKPIERQRIIIGKIKKKGSVNIIARTRDEFESSFPPLYLDLAIDGIVLYDKGGYVEKKLSEIKGLIKKAGLFREKRDYGFNWKWKKKPSINWRIDWSGVYGIR